MPNDTTHQYLVQTIKAEQNSMIMLPSWNVDVFLDTGKNKTCQTLQRDPSCPRIGANTP